MTARVLVPGFALFLAVLSGHAAGQEPRRLPARPPAAEPAPRTEVRVFTLRNTDAAEMVQTLRDLFAGDDAKKFRLAVHRSTNSVLATGLEDDLDRVNAIIARLEDAAGEKKKDAGKAPREQGQKQPDEAKQKVALAEAEVEQARERAAWSERMVKLGYASAAQSVAERVRLEEVQSRLVTARAELATLQAAQDRPKPAAGTAWEYKVLHPAGSEARWEDELNKLGADGWELAGVDPKIREGRSTGTTLFFKRAKR